MVSDIKSTWDIIPLLYICVTPNFVNPVCNITCKVSIYAFDIIQHKFRIGPQMLFDWISLSSIMWVFIRVAIRAAWSSSLRIASDFSFSGGNLDFPIIREHFIWSFWSRNLNNSFEVSLQNPCHLGISILRNSLTFSFQSNHRFSNSLGVGVSQSNFNCQRSCMMSFGLIRIGAQVLFVL